MISALCWVPKGAAKAMPDVAEPSPEELEAMKAQAEQAALEGAMHAWQGRRTKIPY